MNKLHIMRTVCAVGVSAACAWGLAGCSGTGAASGDSNGSDSVAATVDGVEISESDVTAYVESLRSSYSLTDEESWGKSLAQQGLSVAEFREQVIDAFVTREIIRSHAADRGITVESSEVDSYIQQTKSNYDDDEKWQAALQQAGMTEDDYRKEIELQLMDKYLQESFATDDALSESDQLQYAQMYASAYDGAKRSSHILFSSEDEATAQDVLNRINAGELDFAEAAKEYSQDTGSAENGGDVGWDKTSSFVEEYQTALDSLAKDQVSGLVTSTYGLHIIKCTDVYNAPKTTGEDGAETVEITSIDQIPSEWLDKINESLKSQKQTEAYQQWLEEQREASNVQINEMPDGLPYYVDVTKYQTEEEGSGTDASADDAAAEADGSADGTADEAAAEGEGDQGGTGDAEAADGSGAGTEGASSEQPAEAA